MNAFYDTLLSTLTQVGITILIAALIAGVRLYLRSASEYIVYGALAMNEWLFNEKGTTVVMPSKRVWQHRGGDLISYDRRNARTRSSGEKREEDSDVNGIRWYSPIAVTVAGRTPTWHYAPISKERLSKWKWHRKTIWFSMVYKRSSRDEVLEYQKTAPYFLGYEFDPSSMISDMDIGTEA